MSIQIRELLDEYDLDLTDIRWFLSLQMSERLLTYTEQPTELAELVWRGTLEADLYDMEERFLTESQDQLDRGLMDEARIREKLSAALAARRLRRR
jgi:uncharacterized protein (UPF0548 family)